MLTDILSKFMPAKKPLKKTVIGLDVDEKSVKLVEIKKTPQGSTLTNFVIEEIPAASTEDKATQIAKTIRKVVAENAIEAGEVYTAVSGPGVSIRRITVPEMPEDELFGAVRWEAKNLIPFPLESVTLDFYTIGKIVEKGVPKLDIIIVAAQTEAINNQQRSIEGSGLKVSGVTATPFALWDILKRNVSLKGDEVIALVDIGAESASINLFKNNILQFTREISVAGDSITKAMTGVLISDQWQLSLTYEQAEKIKIDWGIPREDSQEKTAEGIPLSQILEVMKPTLRRMLNEILRSFDYYKEQFREEKINKVFLAGGSSKLKNLEDYLTAGLGVKVEIVNPLENLSISIPDSSKLSLLKDVSPRLALALGLGLGEAHTLNLIHVKKPVKKGLDVEQFGKLFEGMEAPVMTWAIPLVLILVLILGYNFYLGRMLSYYRSEVESKQAILQDLRSLAERKDIIDKISKEETKLRETLSLFNTTIPQGIELSQLSYDNGSRRINISGTATAPKLVGKFLRSIEDSPDFSNATLIESRGNPDGGGMTFRMSLHVD